MKKSPENAKKFKVEHNECRITVNGEPLYLYLSRIEEEEKHSEIVAEVQSEIKKQKACIPHYIPKHNKLEKNGISKRVKYLTLKEIRKEYGYMSTPHKTHVERIIYTIVDQGPLSINEISRHLSLPYSSITAQLTRIIKKLPDIIGKEDSTSPVTYGKLIEIDPENAVETYRSRKGKAKKEASKVQRGGETKLEVTSDIEIPKEIKVKIEVSGQVQVVFNFQK